VVGTLRASVRFAAALCEFSGSFLIFPSALCVGNHTQRSMFKDLAPWPPHSLSSQLQRGRGQPLIFNRSLAMKTERLVGHHEARDALVLSIAGVTAVILIESLVLLIGY
jgi:hypothetical protein